MAEQVAYFLPTPNVSVQTQTKCQDLEYRSWKETLFEIGASQSSSSLYRNLINILEWNRHAQLYKYMHLGSDVHNVIVRKFDPHCVPWA